MTARDLLTELQALSCHALTDTNVEAVMFDGGRLWLDMVDRDAEQIDDLKDSLAATEAACKEAEAEVKGLNAELDRVSDAEWIAADEAAQIERIKHEARRVMERCEKAERELTALRKRQDQAGARCRFPKGVRGHRRRQGCVTRITHAFGSPQPVEGGPDMSTKKTFWRRLLCRLSLCGGYVDHEVDSKSVWWIGLRCATCGKLNCPTKSAYQDKEPKP